MNKAKRRARYAEKIKEELRQRWMRELLGDQQANARQADRIKARVDFGKA